MIHELTDMQKLLMATADLHNPEAAKAARRELAVALELPLRKGVMAGNIVEGIYEKVYFNYGESIEYPLDWLAPGTEKEYVAYLIPNQGRLPEKHFEGDYVTIPTYALGFAHDTSMKYARDARWDVMARAVKVIQSAMIKKMNDDGWHALIGAGVDRNIVVFDSQANSGQFTKRLVSLCKTVMRRNGGGNSTSVNRGRLTDLFISPEAGEDMRNWGVDQIDEVTRKEIYDADDNSETVSSIFKVRIHTIDELGEAQEYQNFYSSELGASLATGDLEFVLGLDLDNSDSFINPIREDINIVDREDLFSQRRIGWTAFAEVGWAILNGRRTLVGTL